MQQHTHTYPRAVPCLHSLRKYAPLHTDVYMQYKSVYMHAGVCLCVCARNYGHMPICAYAHISCRHPRACIFTFTHTPSNSYTCTCASSMNVSASALNCLDMHIHVKNFHANCPQCFGECIFVSSQQHCMHCGLMCMSPPGLSIDRCSGRTHP